MFRTDGSLTHAATRCVAILIAFFAFAMPAAAANPVQRENARPGSTGWQMPAGSGQAISVYASDASIAPGQSFHLHVRAPLGSRYRIELYRLGWYGGAGGHLLACAPRCAGTRAAVAQAASSAPDPRSGLIHTRWSTTDVIRTSKRWVSGYYEAKLIVVDGPQAGSAGRIPLVVREARPRAAVLVQVPVNT